MLTINSTDSNNQPHRISNPTSVEVYIGAMMSYEHFDLGGVHWKLPTGMVLDLIEVYQKSQKEPVSYETNDKEW